MTNLLTQIYLLCLFIVNVNASLHLDYMSIKPNYNAGDFMEINVIQIPEAADVGDPTITLFLYDEFGKIQLQTIYGPQPLTDLPRRKPYLVHYWEIPTEISSDFEVGPRYRLKMIYSQSKKESTEPVTESQEHMVNIRGLKALPGNKPNPAYKGAGASQSQLQQPQQEQDQIRPYPPAVNQPSVNSKSGMPKESIRVSDGATWAYNMIKTLLVHLLV